MTGDMLRIDDSLRQIEDQVSQWRKKFGEHGLEALEEVTFNDLPMNNMESQSCWCNWALSTGNDTCQPFYQHTMNQKMRDLSSKPRFCSCYITLPCHSLNKSLLLGHLSVPSHCCHICNTHHMVIPHQQKGPLQEEASWSTCPFDPSCNSIHTILIYLLLTCMTTISRQSRLSPGGRQVRL